MKILDPGVELLGMGPQASEKDALRLIELAGRVCYKSEEKIGPGTAEALLERLVKNGHTSVLEHASMLLPISEDEFHDNYELTIDKGYVVREDYLPGKSIGLSAAGYVGNGGSHFLLGMNYRGLINNQDAYPELLPTCLQDGFAPSKWRKPLSGEDLIRWGLQDDKMLSIIPRFLTFTLRATCDRGVSHEMVRHRVMSFSQESTRYCDYGDSGINVIIPRGLIDGKEPDATEEEVSNLATWEEAMFASEKAYQALRVAQVPPQVARSVLPNSLKTEVVITGTLEQWNHFFSLRIGSRVQPDMLYLAEWMYSVIEGKLAEFDENLPKNLLLAV